MSTTKSNKAQRVGLETFGWSFAAIAAIILFVTGAIEWLAERVGLKLHLFEGLDAQGESGNGRRNHNLDYLKSSRRKVSWEES